MTLTWVFLASTLALCNCWVLNVNVKHVAKKLTNNITLDCRYDGNDNEEATLSIVNRIRLLKFVTGNKWKTVAKISDIHPNVVTTLKGATQMSGHAGTRAASFMTIHFDTATDDIIGQFQCEVDGYDIDDELTAVKTDPIDITERGVSYDDILDIILKLKSKEEGVQNSNELRMGLLENAVRNLEKQGQSRSVVISGLTNRVNMLSVNFVKISDDLLKKQKQILQDLEIIKDVTRVQRQAWPEGSYSLLNTSGGCPTSYSFDWITSSIRITTQQGKINKDNTSTPNHIAGPILETSGNYNYMNMRFCSKKILTPGPAWPKGSYCIQNYLSSCPTNLSPGNIQYDRENIGSYDAVTGGLYLPAKNSDTTTVMYCCRDDGESDHPILLPAKDPFYLYRYGLKCQEVIGMDVSNEWMFLDTKETKDLFSNGYHPDATLKNVQLELCYYTPKV